LPTNAAHEPVSCPPEYEKPYAGRVNADVGKFFGMIANIDENVGRLRAKLKEWDIEKNTLVIYMNDNGGHPPAMRIWNAGMRGGKGSAFNGGTRAMSLWCWPGTIQPGACDRLTAHIDLFPTFAELAGAKVPEDVSKKIEGFSLLPLLENSQAPWHDERILITHVGRWGGMTPGAPPVKYGACSVRWQGYLQVREKQKWCLYDLKADPGETKDIAAQHTGIVEKLNGAYDAWWAEVEPCLENEQGYVTAPKVNPFKAQYWKQFNGPGPNNVPPKIPDAAPTKRDKRTKE
jgi:arylsulfatase